MCTSPHEMTSEHIEELIQSYEKTLERDGITEQYAKYVRRQIRNFSEILKERAGNGTYDSAGYRPGDRHETQRTEYQEA